MTVSGAESSDNGAMRSVRIRHAPYVLAMLIGLFVAAATGFFTYIFWLNANGNFSAIGEDFNYVLIYYTAPFICIGSIGYFILILRNYKQHPSFIEFSNQKITLHNRAGRTIVVDPNDVISVRFGDQGEAVVTAPSHPQPIFINLSGMKQDDRYWSSQYLSRLRAFSIHKGSASYDSQNDAAAQKHYKAGWALGAAGFLCVILGLAGYLKPVLTLLTTGRLQWMDFWPVTFPDGTQVDIGPGAVVALGGLLIRAGSRMRAASIQRGRRIVAELFTELQRGLQPNLVEMHNAEAAELIRRLRHSWFVELFATLVGALMAIALAGLSYYFIVVEPWSGDNAYLKWAVLGFTGFVALATWVHRPGPWPRLTK